MRTSTLALAIAYLSLAACDTSLPGERIGAYSVTAALDDSSCGPGVTNPQSRQFDVELRRDGALAYWIGPNGTPLSGTLDDGGGFYFRLENWVTARKPTR